ncbi:uncharacterized protein LOC113312806 [Papaver somniferum]|uniref:uncharacterized protein LOC113312806 n=1 Tax=Papaver somniferum TaxID=3469 RepID=UPI000E701447|nr:uncharacterized protein LOC113312806 [Papaver somniferum]
MNVSTALQMNFVCNLKIMTSNLQKWEAPVLHQLKLNIDASWLNATSISGYGMILRSDSGEAITTRAGKVKATCPEEAEALTLLEAASWAKEMDFQSFWIEGDCHRIMDFANIKPSSIHWRNQAIIFEAKKLLESCGSNFLGFTFKHRSSNKVTDVLAKKARNEGYLKQQ